MMIPLEGVIVDPVTGLLRFETTIEALYRAGERHGFAICRSKIGYVEWAGFLSPSLIDLLTDPPLVVDR